MNTDRLIDMLARGLEPRPWLSGAARMAMILAAGFAVAVLLLLGLWEIRPDIGLAYGTVLAKAAFSAAAAAAALPLAMRLMRPGRSLGWRIGAVAIFVGVAALASILALMGEAPERRIEAWTGGGFPWCLVLVPILATPTAVGLIWLMRDFAPTRLTFSGAAIGAVSGGVGAMAYSMYCPVDSVAFVTTWYVVSIALCAALGALVGAKLLRW